MNEPSRPQPSSLRPARLESAIADVRWHIRSAVVLRGVGLLWLALLGLCILSFCLDRSFRLSVTARTLTLVACGAVWLELARRLVLMPLIRPLTPTAMTDLLERRFPELEDRVRSALFFLRDPLVTHGSVTVDDMQVAMKRRAVVEAYDGLGKIQVNRVIDAAAVVSPLTFAAFSLACLLAILPVAGDALLIWLQRQFLLSSTADWPYRTQLAIAGFADGDTVGVPRGDPWQLRVTASGEIPQRVRLFVTYPGETPSGQGSTRRYSLAPDPSGAGVFSYEEPEVTAGFSFYVEGGDYSSPPYHVRVLERPAVSTIAFRVEYPAYTRKSADTFDGATAELNVPEGSVVHVTGAATKDLREVSLATAGSLIPLQVAAANRRQFSGSFTPKEAGAVTLHMEDTESVRPDELFHFFVHLTPDTRPTVRAARVGVTSMVTPQARIPLRIVARDDYGITTLGLRYVLGASTAVDERSEDGEATPKPPEKPTDHELAKFEPADTPIETTRAWDLQPLNIQPERRLDVRVFAVDNDALNGAKEGISAPMSFLVVTPERLAEDLKNREIKARQTLEKLREDEQKVLDRVYQMMAREWKEKGELPVAIKTEMIELVKTEKRLARQIDTLATRIASLLEEMENNRIAESKDIARLAEKIISPLRQIAREDLNQAAQDIGRIRDTDADAERLSRGWELTEDMKSILQTMDTVLANMLRLEGFTEIVHMLRVIIKTQAESASEAQRLYEETVETIFDEFDAPEEDTPEEETPEESTPDGDAKRKNDSNENDADQREEGDKTDG